MWKLYKEKCFCNKTRPPSRINPPKIVVTLRKPRLYTTTRGWLKGWSLFVLAGNFFFPLYEYYIEKNVNSKCIWRRVIPVLHSENLFIQYRFIYFIYFFCFDFSFFYSAIWYRFIYFIYFLCIDFSFFTVLYGKSSIT